MLQCDYNPAFHHFPAEQPDCILRLRKAVGFDSLHAMLHKDFGLWEVVCRGNDGDGRPVILELGYMGSGKGEGPSFSGDCYDEYVRKLKTLIGAAEVKAIQQQRGADQLRSMQGVVDRSDEAKQRIVGRVKQRHGALVAERAAHAYGMDNNDFGGIPG